MTMTRDRLEEVKALLGLTSNYQLAKRLQVSQADISYAYKGEYKADEYLATRIALELGIEPIHLIAELRAEDEKNETKREFWRSFLTRAALVIASATALTFGLPSSSEAGAPQGNFRAQGPDITANYAQRRRQGRKHWQRWIVDLWLACKRQALKVKTVNAAKIAKRSCTSPPAPPFGFAR